MNTSYTPRFVPLSARPRALGLLVAAAGFSALSATAQVAAPAPTGPDGVLNLSASATVEAPSDWMTVSWSVTRDHADAGVVQTQLKQALDAALAEARKQARPGQVEVRVGGFSVFPRYGSKGAISGWQGNTELVVEGRDMAAIAQLVGRISTLTVQRVGYTLSRESQEKLAADASAQAIGRFRAQAAEQAKAFGYGGYLIREVSVNADGGGGSPAPMPRLMAAEAKMMDAAPMPVAPGKATVTATVSGSVQMK